MKFSTFPTGCIALAALCAAMFACDEKKPAPAPTTTVAAPGDHDHEHGPNGEHLDGTASHTHGHGGPVIELGSATIGSFEAVATRDEGQIVAGKDASIDVTVTPAAGSTAKAVAVRFWIGTEDAKGSVKARADIENPAEPNRWHTHAEIPSPIPTDSKLWIEIEDDKGGTSVGSFELKMQG